MMPAARGLVALAAMLAIAPPVSAGEAPEPEPRFTPTRIAAFSKRVERELAERGARVALVARVGRDRASLPAGIEFTHVAFAVYSEIRLADGRVVRGYAMHNLYQEAGSSRLVQDYPLDYYAAVHLLEAGIVIPRPELQRRLLALIGSDAYESLHNPRYSVLANPFTSDFQNCTEFVLDAINAAVYDTTDPRRLKANAAAYFEPHPVELRGPFQRLSALLSPGIAMSDHEGPMRTATFGSLARYLREHGLADEAFVVREADATADLEAAP